MERPTRCAMSYSIERVGARMTAGLIALAMATFISVPDVIAADEQLPVAAFAQLPMASGAQLSPNGKYFAYFRPVKGRRYLVVQSIDGSDGPYAVPPQGEVEFSWLRWANEERLVVALAYSGRRGRTETTETRLISLRYDATDLVPLIKPSRKDASSLRSDGAYHPDPQIQDNVIDWLRDETNFVLVSLDGDFNAASEVRRIDIRSGDYQVVQQDSRGIQGWMTDQAHAVRIGYGYDPISGYNMRLRSADGQWIDAADQQWWKSGHEPAAFAEDPNLIYVAGPGGDGLRRISTLAIASGELVETVFSHESVDADGLVYDSVTGRPVGVRYTDDYPRIRYFDSEYQKLQRSIDRALPDTVNEISSVSKDHQRILVRSFSDVVPGRYFLWDREAGRLDFMADTMPGLAPELLSPVQPHWIEIPDGGRIEAFLTLPRGSEAGALPAVVLPHGGPRTRDDRGFWFLSQFLASRGYAVLQPNFRGSTGYGAAFERAGLQQWGGVMQDDVTVATRWLAESGYADPERVCIVGWSYGGYAAAMGVIKAPELYNCAVSINGVLNLPRLITDDKKYIGGSEWTEHVGLDEERSSAVSPYHLAAEIEDPVLVIQAADDTRVHLDQGESFSRRLQQLDKDIEYVEVEFGGHSMTNEAARQIILSRVEAFLEKHL